jgi:hypothetical protein
MLKTRENKNIIPDGILLHEIELLAHHLRLCAVAPHGAIVVSAFVGSSFYFKYKIFWFFIPISVRKDTI